MDFFAVLTVIKILLILLQIVLLWCIIAGIAFIEIYKTKNNENTQRKALFLN